jgi:crotonobetainyl-CoA:carnitine CoA-transferase CaiB-like acyl-CoA transferase
MTKALSKLRILELGRMFSAPWTGQLFADLGAEVIKVESPQGDTTRKGGGVAVKDANGQPADDHATFISVNRNKKSIVVDLTLPEGRDIVLRLAEHCDVLIENFKAGDLQRRGLDYAAVRRVNPRIVYLSLSGFGQDGPYSHRPAMDAVVQAMSGYLNLTRTPEREPALSPMVMNDFAAGMYAFAGIMTALYHRDAHEGGGQYIDLALMDAGVAMLSFRLQAAILAEHNLPQDLSSTRFAPSGLYQAADGQFQIAIGSDADFTSFCEALGSTQLTTDPRFATRELRSANKVALNDIVRPLLARGTLQEWLERFSAANVMFSPLYSFKQMMADPHVRTRDLFVKVPHAAGGSVELIRNPLRMSETPVDEYVSPPLLGQHTREVLSELLQMSDEDIERLFRAGAVRGS